MGFNSGFRGLKKLERHKTGAHRRNWLQVICFSKAKIEVPEPGTFVPYVHSSNWV